MIRSAPIRLAAPLLAALALLGCAPTDVQTTFSQSIAMPRPDSVWVYDFAVAPDEVHLDRGVVGDVESYASSKPRSELERAVGHQVAKALSLELAKKINAMGLPAQRVWGMPARRGNAVVIEGQLISVDQGSQAERIVIGLAAGRSRVEARAQLLADTPAGLRQLEGFRTDVESGYKPGMAETMGAGALGAHLAAAAAVSVLSTALTEKLSADVDAEAKRTADALAQQLQPYFQSQGWIARQY
ncbi:MAG: DUF4410 domain-containing protein [Myxococcota bacterium]